MREVRLTAESEVVKVEESIEAIEYELANEMNAMYDLIELINKFKGVDNQVLKMK